MADRKQTFVRVREQGVSFTFKKDPDAPEMLHIYARHLTTIDDALDVFFDVQATESWNERHQRFERYNATHSIFWFWLDQHQKSVMIITCFKL